MRSKRCELLGFFIDEPVRSGCRSSCLVPRVFNSCDQFSGRDDSGASGSAGQQ